MNQRLFVLLWLFLGPLLSVAVGGSELRELEAELAAREPAQRRRAVRALAELGGREAFELVIGALADPSGEVGDEAQLRLAGLDDARLLKALLGKRGLGSGDEWVRRRVAEAFGRMELSVPCEDLVLAVSRKDELSSELLLWSIERRARCGRLEGDVARCTRELIRLVERRGPVRLRAGGLCALAAVDRQAALPRADELLGSREALLRSAALEVLCREASGAAERACRALSGDSEPCVRAAALAGLASLGTLDAAAVLIERLEAEPRQRLAARALAALQDLSGLKYRADPRPWRLWWSQQEGGLVPKRAGATTEPRTSASLAGLPILSDRLTLLVDFSGSLWYEREGRPARKGKVDELLRETLPRLGEATCFNLIPYTKEPHPWRPELVTASERNVRAALADFEQATMRGSGNVFDAAILALEDPRVDTLLVFTDGAPTGGRHWNLELMVPLLEQAARWRHVAFDAVLVDTPPGLARRWEALSRSTGGLARRVDL